MQHENENVMANDKRNEHTHTNGRHHEEEEEEEKLTELRKYHSNGWIFIEEFSPNKKKNSYRNCFVFYNALQMDYRCTK